MTLGQIIRLKRQEKNFTQADLAKASGVSIQSIKLYETDKTNATMSIIEKLAKALDSDVSYFLSLNMSPIVPEVSLNNKVVETVQQENDENKIIHIPRYSDKASAGNGITNYHSEQSVLSFTERELLMHFDVHSSTNLSIIESIGDSMCPTIAEGSLLLMQREYEVLEGCIYVVRLDGDLYVKRIQKRPKIKLISDNPKYDPIELAENEELIIVGRVVGSVAIKRF